MKKIIIAIAVLTLLICIAIGVGQSGLLDNLGGESTETTQITTLVTETVSSSVSLGYYQGKSFNPYKTNSPTNLKISTLLYDSLFVMNENYSCEKLLASDCINDGKQLTVTLIEDAVFSNGATLSAYDIVYSFGLARKSEFFKGRLSNFSAAAIDSNRVIFTLKQPDIYAESCLTFPIVQNNTGGAALPVGSGRYILINHQGKYILTQNTTSTRHENLKTAQIGLVPINSENTQVYLIQTGELSYFYDDMQGGKVTNVNANTVPLTTNNLIYLGYNNQTEALKSSQVINALFHTINKSTISDTVFDNICTPTSIPFNPAWHILEGITVPSYEHNIIKAGELLDSAGYSFSGTAEQHRENLSLRLIVNKESTAKLKIAKLIAADLKSVGISVTTQALEFSAFEQALKSGEYDLYVGEVKISPNMDLSCFFTKGGGSSYGISPTSTVAKAYTDFRSGSIDITTFIQIFDAEKPFLPICFKGAMTYYSKEISFEDTANEYEPFINIYSWSTSRKGS